VEVQLIHREQNIERVLNPRDWLFRERTFGATV
jgi:hypothetical protein